ncbi:hypothetical protein [Leifsonia sp. Leaf264]|uniref:hypothetical protein n=1 Tax=Leifsonia sp. Leaf264 TaxID=1736314 RepID=UPI0006F2ABE5|nr:hypothetical protein [Leifsonia sp. Leaf264]KQO98392.1 hypothetical protein ASF30_10045 [Leifsonia sp. Leaf264]
MTRKSKTRIRYDVRYWRTPEMAAFKALTEQPGYEPAYESKLAEQLGMDSNHPAFGGQLRAAAKEQARARRRNGSHVTCAWGSCTVSLDEQGKVTGGFGQPGCPCDNTPGWNSEWPAGMGKPSMPVKAVGRHGSRVQRARRRKQEVTVFRGRQIMKFMVGYYDEDTDYA